jgi:hypothetical protein
MAAWWLDRSAPIAAIEAGISCPEYILDRSGQFVASHRSRRLD